jgi:hypothetical protein
LISVKHEGRLEVDAAEDPGVYFELFEVSLAWHTTRFDCRRGPGCCRERGKSAMKVADESIGHNQFSCR